MAITIRNKELEAEIKALGAKYGKGPTDVLRHILDEHAKQAIERERLEKEALKARRRTAMDELMAYARAHVTDEDRRIIQRSAEEMYGEDGLPK